jgi:hypothetical protein
LAKRPPIITEPSFVKFSNGEKSLYLDADINAVLSQNNQQQNNVRYMKASSNNEKLIEKQVNKKGFNYVGGYDGVYGATVNSKRFQKMSKQQ